MAKRAQRGKRQTCQPGQKQEMRSRRGRRAGKNITQPQQHDPAGRIMAKTIIARSVRGETKSCGISGPPPRAAPDRSCRNAKRGRGKEQPGEHRRKCLSKVGSGAGGRGSIGEWRQRQRRPRSRQPKAQPEARGSDHCGERQKKQRLARVRFYRLAPDAATP